MSASLKDGKVEAWREPTAEPTAVLTLTLTVIAVAAVATLAWLSACFTISCISSSSGLGGIESRAPTLLRGGQIAPLYTMCCAMCCTSRPHVRGKVRVR